MEAFLRYWPFVRGIYRSPVNSTHRGQWCGALMLYLIWTWINGRVNNRDTGDLRRHHTHYGVTVMHDILGWNEAATWYALQNTRKNYFYFIGYSRSFKLVYGISFDIMHVWIIKMLSRVEQENDSVCSMWSTVYLCYVYFHVLRTHMLIYPYYLGPLPKHWNIGSNPEWCELSPLVSKHTKTQ